MFKKTPNGLMWLIIKPRPSKTSPNDRYQLPKGHIEKGETEEQAALREVFEETGVAARIIEKVGDTEFLMNVDGKESTLKTIAYFLMEYKSGKFYENSEIENLLWLEFNEAREKLTYVDDKEILAKALKLTAGWPSTSTTS